MKKLELTEEEIKILENYLFRKIINLENSGLADSKCYYILYSIYNKLGGKKWILKDLIKLLLGKLN